MASAGSSSEEYLASLGIDTSDMNKAVDQTVSLLAHLGEHFDSLLGRATKAETALTGVGRGGRDGGDGIRAASRAAEEGGDAWSEYAKQLREARAAYGEFRRGQVTGEGGGSDMPGSRAGQNELIEIQEAATANLITEIRKRQRAEEAAVRESLSEFERAHRERVQAYSAEVRAAQRRDEEIARSERQAAAARTAEIGSRNYANASVLYDADIAERQQAGTAFSQGLRARMEEEAAAAAGTTMNLTRLRYAVYDVSNALGVAGIATTALVAGVAGAGIAYEREFANVRRTVGLTGDAADELYSEFLQLTNEIPVAFSELSEIGTAAGQLGVAEDRVASFTETVAKFAATTDVTTDASATAFGRLDQLIDGVDGRYENLASSILNVGVNSVATESSIVSIASQIAATGNQAGLTADEIIGLSGSLASLGVAPEAARGTILRVFSQINSAISSGGERLNDFASISGMAADEFRQGWSSDFTSTFLAFLNGIDSNGVGAEQALRALGITATRDINAMLKLAQNTEQLSQDLALASTGFQSGAVLTEQYGVIADTTAARLQTFVNSLSSFFAVLGEGTQGPLNFFLDRGTQFLALLTEWMSNPVTQWVVALGLGITGLVGIMLLLTAMAGRATGSYLALRSAIMETNVATWAGTGGLKGYTAALVGAEGAARGFGAALKATGIGALISVGAWLLTEAIMGLSTAMQDGRAEAEAYFGSLDGLAEAVRSDNPAVFADQVDKARGEFVEAATATDSWVDTLKAAAQAQADLEAATSGSNDQIDAQTLKIGSNTQEWLRNALASSESFRAIFENLDQLNRLTGQSSFSAGGISVDYEAFDLEQYVDLATTKGGDAANAFFDSWYMGLVEKFQAESGTGGNVAPLVEEALGGADTVRRVYEAGEKIGLAVQEGMAEAASLDAQNAFLDAFTGSVDAAADVSTDAFGQIMDDIFGVINAEYELMDSTRALGEEFATNGASVAFSGSAMQSVIQSIYESSSGSAEAAARMQGLFNALIEGGYASAQQLAPLAAIIAQLAGGKAVRAAAFDMTSFSEGIEKVKVAAGGRSGGGRGGAAKEVRTLVDYANDLNKVFDRSFDIRFSGQQGLDQISTGWQTIRDNTAEARRQIREYRAELQSLQADRAVREYWLGVAEDYGDTLRAGELRAEIAEIDAKLKETTEDLSDAQSKNSKELEGNSEAAIDNRATILGLVGDYGDYLQALAASGMSQQDLQARAAQLKQEFIAQATQLGFSRDEVMKYAKSFDDMSTTISRVPRNITVRANTDPALQALAELEAQARKLGGSTFAGPKITNPTVAKEIRRMALESAIVARSAWVQQLAREGNTRGAVSAASSVDDMRIRLQTGNYRRGGWTGNIPPWEEAGTVHGREFVLNQQGAQMFPRQMLEAANQGRAPIMPRAAAPMRFPDRMVVELSPIDRELVAEGANVTVLLTADQVAAANSSANGQARKRGAN